MPLTTVDPQPALVVIDVQSGIVGMATQPHAAADVVARSASLAEAFRAQGHPVVLVRVIGTPAGRTDANPDGGGRTIPAEGAVLVPELGEGIVVTKRTRGAFTGTDLHDRLQETGVTQVFLTGIATAAGVEETGREAFAHGYHVVVVEDACADRTAERHAYAVDHVLPTLAQVTTTAEVLAAL
ncbi:isochorismatase family protein [Nocardioides sp. CER19]|uniref:isochorismatase family protein n=1 Tax=Nocardioides sp. CER19 TaxID=3038538 RepID=UPI00244C1247|nr:isochorismatase family protein [Nocardioides sp. CER19]MDH2413828.1 isochorismatase family protein [Nocardioides sp. CER19]